jgi:iron(III) transport system substrate-binding protein
VTLRLTVLMLVALAVTPAAAQGFQPDPIDVDAAKREGKVSWYTSAPVSLSQKLGSLFEQQTGIKVGIFRSGGSAVLRRFQQEADAGRLAVDVLTMSDASAAQGLARRGRFVAFKPEGFDKVVDEGKDPAYNYFGPIHL